MTKVTFPTRILVLVDDAPPARLALGMATRMAAATGSELHLVHVVYVSRYNYPEVMSEGQRGRIEREGEARMAGFRAEAEAEGAEVAGAHVRMGRIDGEVMRLAEELRVGMIVVGNRSGDAIERILLGNDAESIVRHAHCPVLVVREDEYLRA